MPIQHNEVENLAQAAGAEPTAGVTPYPVDMSAFLTPGHGPLASGARASPARAAHYALAHWNRYLSSGEKHDYTVFLTQAHWLVDQQMCSGEDAGGWPVYPARGPWLSALAQGWAISVLVRAYQAAHEETLLVAARRAARSFEQDILDGGVATPVGRDGVFFEEFAVYPAAHTLSGFLFALFGLYDYVGLTGDVRIEQLIARAQATLQRISCEFDTGFWTYTDLLQRRLASPAELSLQVKLLEALGRYADCDHCTLLALRWRNYLSRPGTRLRYQVASRYSACTRALGKRLRAALFPQGGGSQGGGKASQGGGKRRPYYIRAAQGDLLYSPGPLRVCIPLAEFPFTGGVLTVVEGIVQVTGDIWKIEYLAQQVGRNEKGYLIHRFGTTRTDSWFFPVVWLYSLAGFVKLFALMRHDAGYDVILPQDGAFTGVFAGLAARLAGVRVVCIDHSTLTSLKSPRHHAERVQFIGAKPWPRRLLHNLLTVPYWPSLYLQASIAARCIDHYLVPGIAGDGVEEALARFGVHESRITRFASMVDIDRHIVLDDASKASVGEQKGIAADAIVVAIICRLSPEKGVNIALTAIGQALAALSFDVRERVRVIIAGEGPLREEIEEDITRLGLNATCQMWGNIMAEEVIALLAISDIFLYTSTRGACFPMAVLEAMASGCAVIASTQPASNGVLLDGRNELRSYGRGIAVEAGDVEQTAEALTRLLSDMELARRMGQAARNYIAQHHSPVSFRRALLRTTGWPVGNKGLFGTPMASVNEPQWEGRGHYLSPRQGAQGAPPPSSLPLSLRGVPTPSGEKGEGE